MAESTGFGITVSGLPTARLLSVNHGGMSRESIDYSNAASVDGWMEKKPGDIKDPGQLEVEIIFDPADLGAWLALLVAPAATVDVEYPDGVTVSGEAFLTEFEDEAPYDDKMTASATFEFTGEVSA